MEPQLIPTDTTVVQPNPKPKILVIGTGYIGNRVIRKLKSLGYEVEIFDIIFGQDVLDVAQLEPAIQRNDYVLLMAAVADLNKFEELPLHGMSVNIWGVTLVSNFCTKYKKRIFYISTCCVYGNTLDLPSDEESRVNPSEIYACAKYAGEWIVKGYHRSYDLEYVILRIPTTFGSVEMRDALAPAIFIGKALSGETIQIHGTGEQTRTLTYIDDTVDGIVAALEHSEVVNEIINISTQEELSVLDWVEIINDECSKITGQRVPVEFVGDRKGQTFKEQINVAKAKRLLGWEPKVSFREGIQRTLSEMKQVWAEKELN